MRICLDQPKTTKLPLLARFDGWMQFPSELEPATDFKFSLNKKEMTPKFYQRPDVPPKTGMSVIGWSFICELTQLDINSHGIVTFKIFSMQKEIFRRYFEYLLHTKKPPLVFVMHIPKTAGTSLREELEFAYAPPERLFVYDEPTQYSPRELASFSPRAFDDLSLVCGHFGYGLHKYTSRDFEYIAIIRPPLQFIKSYVFFMKYVKQHSSFLDRDVIDIVGSEDITELDNCYVRYFAGRPDPAPVGQKDLDLAIENIEKNFAFVGTMEFIEESFEYISEHLGRDIKMRRANVTPETREHRELNTLEFDRVAAACVKFDELLYDFVRKRFVEEVQPQCRVDRRIAPATSPPPTDGTTHRRIPPAKAVLRNLSALGSKLTKWG